jgi:4,5-DOPA dioxygenase extradiol
MSMPSLFVSHGAPTLALEDSPTSRFLRTLGAGLPRPRAIVVASAHDASGPIRIGAHPAPPTIHDFAGFSAELHALRYPVPGDPALAARLERALHDAGIDASTDAAHGLDHGAWVPLRHMYPEADIPVVTLSIDPRGDAAAHVAVGRALSFLGCEDILLLGSGGFTHNLGMLDWRRSDAPESAASREFADWLDRALVGADAQALLAWRERAPGAAANHPTIEHLLPLFVAWGAASPRPQARRLHSALAFGALRLDAYSFSRGADDGW